MKIEINLKIFLLIMILVLLNKIDIYIVFIIFILLHEAMHMIIGIILGYKPKKLKLNPFGVSITFFHYNENEKKGRIKRIITYLSGPVLNFIFAIFFTNLNFDIKLKNQIVYTNMLLGIFNLLPIIPLDGGKILKEIISIFFSKKAALTLMLFVTKVFLIFLTAIYSIAIFKIKNIVIFFIILYLWYLYILEEKRAKMLLRVYTVVEKNKYI